MKKIFLTIFTVSILALPVSVLAIDLGGDLVKKTAEEAGYSESTSETTFAETIGTVVKAALSLIGIIFTVLMVYAGYLWMTARGDESKVEKAGKIISSSIIGLIIAVASYAITDFVVRAVLERTIQ